MQLGQLQALITLLLYTFDFITQPTINAFIKITSSPSFSQSFPRVHLSIDYQQG